MTVRKGRAVPSGADSKASDEHRGASPSAPVLGRPEGRPVDDFAKSQRHYAAFVLFNQAMADHVALHPTDLQCLGLLSLEPKPVTVGQIASITGLTSGSATRLVDRLEAAGLVRRTADPDDRRRAIIELTSNVDSDIAAAWDRPGAAFAEVLARYSAEELRLIDDYLRRAAEVGRTQARILKQMPRRSAPGDRLASRRRRAC